MKGTAVTWALFGTALALVLAAVGFLSVRALQFEKAEAQLQASASLEEKVRLAMWRLDSAMAIILAQQSAATPGVLNRLPQQATNIAPQSQAVSQGDLQQRFALSAQIANTPASIANNIATLSNGAMFNNDNTTLILPRLEEGPSPGMPVSIDWASTRAVLLERIADIMPDADIVPLAPAAVPAVDSRRLATIPASLMVPRSAMPRIDLPWNTPLRLSLLLAWSCTLFAAGAVFLLLRGALQLSERRGAFVSAVTHELRTPLTTFRMYADMLAQNMIGDPATRQQYLATLVSESDRLGQLIENVLAYARLERRITGRNAETLSVVQLLERIRPALDRRAEQSTFELRFTCAEGIDERLLRIDPIAVGQIVLNLVDNACKYGRPPIEIDLSAPGDQLHLSVTDAGDGISAPQRQKLFTAFSKSPESNAPGIGLGLHLSRRIARDLGGDLALDPLDTRRTRFILTLPFAA